MYISSANGVQILCIAEAEKIVLNVTKCARIENRRKKVCVGYFYLSSLTYMFSTHWKNLIERLFKYNINDITMGPNNLNINICRK